MIMLMLFTYVIEFKTLDRLEKNAKSTERRKPGFGKEYVENAGLYKPVLNKTMTTRE